MAQLPEYKCENPYNRANSLEELLSWDDVDFVCCAYVTILGRQPDPLGKAHFLQQIRQGYSKLDVLWRLRQSLEAKDHDPGIAGLDRDLKRAAWERRPLLGALARFQRAGADGGSRSDRALRALMNSASVNQRNLQAIDERLTADQASSGLRTELSAEPTLAVGQTHEVFGYLPSDRLKGMEYSETPELDHLREKAILKRFFGDVA